MPLLCLAGAGGGHLRQLLDLEPLWRDYSHFFVTEDTPLGAAIAEKAPTEFVAHFALGQARLGAPLLMLSRAWRNCWQSLRIIAQRRPDCVISTGSGSQFFTVFWARVLGARIILIDSLARFDRPSAFARLTGPFAHRRYAQSAEAARQWPRAIAIDPIVAVDTPTPQKEDLVFATVGATLPFERLARLVVDAKRSGAIGERIVLQVGRTSAPDTHLEGLECVDTLDFAEVQQMLVKARIVICHGGTGSIISALQNHCHVIVIPRQFELGEHYDDHQAEITRAFQRRALVHVAEDPASLAKALETARSAPAKAATTDYTALIADLRRYLSGQFADQ